MSSSASDVLFVGLSAKDLLVSVGWFLTIWGWLVSNSQANKRENRKEARTELEACCKMAADLLQKSRTYYSREPSHDEEKAVAAEMRFDLLRLFTRVERLENKYPAFDVIGACSELLDSVSGGEFESKKRKILAPDSQKLCKIESDIHYLIDCLESGYGKTFAPSLSTQTLSMYKKPTKKLLKGKTK